MIIILRVKSPMHMAQSVKESLAMHLERFGDTRVLEVRPEEEQGQEQLTFPDFVNLNFRRKTI